LVTLANCVGTMGELANQGGKAMALGLECLQPEKVCSSSDGVKGGAGVGAESSCHLVNDMGREQIVKLNLLVGH
jgi:hypothetical protein